MSILNLIKSMNLYLIIWMRLTFQMSALNTK